ncbi:MAG: thioredoxin family protein [Deltaproteobacteria bacterium]|nr:thioredoxin family protein [Deltaproteobacteria bacterium]
MEARGSTDRAGGAALVGNGRPPADRGGYRLKEGLALILLALTAAGCFAASGQDSAAKMDWVKNYPDGLRLARESGKPAMVYFTADWCGPCVELKKYVWSDKRVIEASKQLINIYVDVDQDTDTLAAYKVRGIPAVFFLSPAGEMVMKLAGDHSPANFAKQMNSLAAKYPKGK